MSVAQRADPAVSASDDVAGQRRTTIASIFAAAFQMVLMLGAGLVTGSLGLVSAGVESTGDVVAAVVTFFAVQSDTAARFGAGSAPG
jgi:divalent metal cation (Fe/Co/Zn/Cd) transporter